MKSAMGFATLHGSLCVSLSLSPVLSVLSLSVLSLCLSPLPALLLSSSYSFSSFCAACFLPFLLLLLRCVLPPERLSACRLRWRRSEEGVSCCDEGGAAATKELEGRSSSDEGRRNGKGKAASCLRSSSSVLCLLLSFFFCVLLPQRVCAG